MNTFRLRVISLRNTMCDEQVGSVFLSGDEGEFELLPFHYPLMASLPEGEIKLGSGESIPLRNGVVLFQNNECTIIMEEVEEDAEQAA